MDWRKQPGEATLEQLKNPLASWKFSKSPASSDPDLIEMYLVLQRRPSASRGTKLLRHSSQTAQSRQLPDFKFCAKLSFQIMKGALHERVKGDFRIHLWPQALPHASCLFSAPNYTAVFSWIHVLYSSKPHCDDHVSVTGNVIRSQVTMR